MDELDKYVPKWIHLKLYNKWKMQVVDGNTHFKKLNIVDRQSYIGW